ncbi:MAG: hypothetical protein J7M38_07455, partial [Armatimonadetes bacterium]|nr:hypothetical protein [Armatimonadota bacterium]
LPSRPLLITQRVTGEMGGERIETDMPLLGAHQLINAGVAAAVCERLGECDMPVGPASFARGLSQVQWPGRMQVVQARPWLVLDCAHNPDSARALMAALRRHLRFDRLILVLGISRDKDAPGIAAAMRDADHVIITRAQLKRAMDMGTLAERTGPLWRSFEMQGTCADALARARELAGESDAICVTGSIFVVGEAMQLLGVEPFPVQRSH